MFLQIYLQLTVLCFSSGKVLFRRSHIRDVAVRRLKHLDNYCKVRQRLYVLYPLTYISLTTLRLFVCVTTIYLRGQVGLTIFFFVGSKSTLSVSVLFSLNICSSISQAGLDIYLPSPALTGKQLLYLHWSFPVTSVNRQPTEETREMGATGVKQTLTNKSESADLKCSSECTWLPDPLVFSESEKGMWGRCFAKCGSSFHLEKLQEICSEGKKLKATKLDFFLITLLYGCLLWFKCSRQKHLILSVQLGQEVVMLRHLCVFFPLF